MKQIVAMIAALLVLTASSAVAQGIKSGTWWYVGLMEFEATVVDQNTVRMYSDQGGMELEFLLKHPANNWKKLTIRAGEDPDAFIIGLPEGTRCRLVRENGNDLIEAYDGMGVLIDVFVKTPDDLSHNERMAWMSEYCGPYTIDCKGDCPNIGLGFGILEEGSLEIPWDIVMPRGVATQCITISDGILQGTWAVFPTVEGLTLNRVEFDNYGMPIEQDERHILRWAATQRPRFGFVFDRILNRSQLEKYDVEALELMRNTILTNRKGASYIEDVNLAIIRQVEARKKGYILPGMLLGEWYSKQGDAELTFAFDLDEEGHLALNFCELSNIKEFNAAYMIVNKKLTIYDVDHPNDGLGDIKVELELQPDGMLQGSYDLVGYERLREGDGTSGMGKRMKGNITMRRR